MLIPRILTEEQRQALAEAVKLLVDVLDACEPDADIEDEGLDEPEEIETTLGWSLTFRQESIHWRGAAVRLDADEAEFDPLDVGEEQCDDEGDQEADQCLTEDQPLGSSMRDAYSAHQARNWRPF